MQLEDFNNMGPLFQKLNDSRLHSRETFKNFPQQGVYVFYDGEKPVYDGAVVPIKQCGVLAQKDQLWRFYSFQTLRSQAASACEQLAGAQ